MRVLIPQSLDESLTMLAQQTGPAYPMAGGTDLMVSWHHRNNQDWTIIDLSRLEGELKSINLTSEFMELGGLVTYWDVMKPESPARAFPLLVDAARQVGAIQIQTRGTWSGNIANGSPAADGVPVMMAYDATVILASHEGRREVRLDEYYTGYKQTVRKKEELIVGVRMPRRKRDMEWFHKVGARRAQAISKVGVAMVHDETGWRVAANSVAPYVLRCRALENALQESQTLPDPDAVHALVLHDISPIDDLRSTAEYRSRALSRIIYYRLLESSTR